MDEKFFRSVDEALANTFDKKTPPAFGGEHGEPVPEVDPDDLKTVWEISREAQTSSPDRQGAISMDVFRRACKGGAHVEATVYRGSILSIVTAITPHEWARLTNDDQPGNAVFRAAVQVPMEWMGVGFVRQGPPFDVEAFMRFCADFSGEQRD